MRHRLTLTLAAFALLTACNVATVGQAPSTIARNQCSGDADCLGGSCVNQQCRSQSGSLQRVLFEVTPPADASSIAGVQYLRWLDGLPTEGGELPAPGLALDLVSQVVGRVILVGRQCQPQFDDNGKPLVFDVKGSSVPALITLTPSTSALGLYSPHTSAKSGIVQESYYGFSVNVPPGLYDIYVEPQHQSDQSCPVPPQLQKNQLLNGGIVDLRVKLPEPSTFDFHVTWPLANGALDGWSVDMLDPSSGRVISNQLPLILSPNSKTDYHAKLAYSPVTDDASGAKADELVRLSPPAGVTAPTVLLARSALGLFDPNSGVLSQLTALPSTVHLQAQVTALDTPNPIAARVTLVATKITGIDPGVLASFVQTVDVAADGKFERDVLPGTYRVSAVPRVELNADAPANADSRLAEATVEWVVASTPSNQAGKVIALSQALPINGQALDTSGKALATALVQAVASPASIQGDVLHQALGDTKPVPRASTASVTGQGDFALIADAGTFDVTVRPLASTGFGWLVFPSVAVATNSAGANLGKDATVPLPVAYRGTVTVPGADGLKQVSNALIRGYVYMSAGHYTADPSKADSVLQVAETRAGNSGEFELLIPAELKAPPRQ